MNEIKDIARSDRCPGISYTDMLNGDSRRPPDYLFEETTIAMGDEPLSVAPYISEEFAGLEREKLWPNVWLFAAREDEMPDPGDSVVFDIAGKSFLLIRQKDGGVKAFYNACLHRGRKLRTESGNSIQLRCPFHGFTWRNDGRQGHDPARSPRRAVAGLCHADREPRSARFQGVARPGSVALRAL
jgi:nitrite reductase/ring-hydroxylating ferredoxin subunit